MTTTSVLLNVVAYVAGVASGWFLFRRPRRTKMSKSRRVTLSGLTALAVGLCFILLGLQQYQSQGVGDERARDDAAQRACLTHWGQDLSDALLARTTANQDLADAQKAKDDATDRVFLITNGLSSEPPRGTKADFADAVADRVAATANLAKVQRSVEATRQDNPYPPPPTLTCGREE